MKKRDFTAAFESDNHIDTGLSLDEAVHGAAPKLDTGRIVARPISILEIYPDPMQPRRAIPSSVRQGWNGSPAGIEGVLIAWHSAVEEESQRQFDLDAYLDVRNGQDADEDDNGQRAIGPMETTFRALVGLAATIYRDGLTNPITIAQLSNQSAATYQLETGERRWLAYHLLHANFPHDEQWTKIPARVVDTSNVWRQAAENNARDNLNVIGKARQLAILLMDLLGREASFEFRTFNEFENEQEYYAQVADGRANPIPDGKTELLLSAIGLKNPVQLRQIRKALRLPDEIWRTADDENWTEGKLRKYIPDDDVTNVTRKTPTPQSNVVNIFATRSTKNRKEYADLIKQVSKISASERLQICQIIEDEIADLERLKNKFEGKS